MNQATHAQHHYLWRVHFIGILIVLVSILLASPMVLGVGSSTINPALAAQITTADSATATTWSLNHPVTESVTIRTRIQLRGDIDSDLSRVWLAAFVADLTVSDAVLALAVVPKTIGWLTAWNLQLHIYPEALRQGSIAISRDYEPTIISLGNLALQPEEIYETSLSFDAQKGQLDIRLTNSTSGAVLYKGQHLTNIYSKTLYPAVGMITHSERHNSIEFVLDAFDAHNFYLATGAEWALVQEKDWMSNTNSVRLVVDDETLGIRLRSKSAVAEGTIIRFLLEYQGTQYPLLHIVPTQGESFIPLPRSAFLPGASQLVMEYVSHDEIWFSESQPLTVGQIKVGFDRVLVNQETGAVTTSFEIDSQGTLADISIDVKGCLTRLIWDRNARSYIHEPYGDFTLFRDRLNLIPGSLQLPLQLPVPMDVPGAWQVQYSVQTEPAIPLQQTSINRYFSTYLPPVPSSEPFTVAILPDTQIYAQHFPEIFTRQTEWLAQNAQSLNLAFVLHLGDITNTNVSEEWMNAQRNLNLLDGVVPYVLTVGNHDMGSNRQTNSRNTPLNTYFPPQQYAGLRGTFEPGRADNSYHIFQAGGKQWLVVALEFGPRDEVLAWANRVVADHADLPTIVITHTYTSTNGGWLTGTGGAAPISYPFAGNPGESVNDGLDMWMAFVRHHPNIFMVISGHIGHKGIPRQTVTGIHGNVVYEMLLDYQYLPLGGEGWMGLMEFQPGEKQVMVLSYSPYLDSCRDGVFDGFTNHFVIDQAAGEFITVGLEEACSISLHLCR